MVLLDLSWDFCPVAIPSTGRKGLKDDHEPVCLLAVPEEPSSMRCCQGRWHLPPCWTPPGRFYCLRVSCQTPHGQKSAWTTRETAFRCLQAAGCFGNVVEFHPVSDFVCAVIFIRWPGSLSHHACSAIYALVFMWSSDSGRLRLSASSLTGARPLLCFVFLSNAANLASSILPLCMRWGNNAALLQHITQLWLCPTEPSPAPLLIHCQIFHVW